MKIVKLAILSLIVLSVTVFLISALLPSKVRISRAIDIYASKEQISRVVSDLSGWNTWNVMVQDTSLNGASFTRTGIHHKKMSVLLEHQSVDSVVITWQRNQTGTRSGFNFINSTQGPTVVQWYFDFNLRWYPWEKFASIIFDKQLGQPMERSLASLKAIVEKNPE